MLNNLICVGRNCKVIKRGKTRESEYEKHTNIFSFETEIKMGQIKSLLSIVIKLNALTF